MKFFRCPHCLEVKQFDGVKEPKKCFQCMNARDSQRSSGWNSLVKGSHEMGCSYRHLTVGLAQRRKRNHAILESN